MNLTPCDRLQPRKPRRTRSKEPKLFTGYIHQPLCEACQQGVDARPKAPGSPPPAMLFTRGRRRTVDTTQHFCPDHDCSYHGWLGRGNIRSNGQPGGQPWRQLQCVSCQGYFSDTCSGSSCIFSVGQAPRRAACKRLSTSVVRKNDAQLTAVCMRRMAPSFMVNTPHTCSG